MLKTQDGISIAADFYQASGDRFAILLHMMPATKESWSTFASALREKGISSLAIDLRGHGKSQGGPDGYKEFTEVEHQSKIQDVRAAWVELERRGAKIEHTTVVGASIGANLAIRFLAEQSSMLCAVALSPGLDYRGVTTNDVIQKIGQNQKLLLVVSDDDTTSALSVAKLRELNPAVEVLEKQGIGHASAMLEKDPQLQIDVINWLDQHL